jgi:hypothetical protein
VSRTPCPVNGGNVDHFAAVSLINSEAETSGTNPQIKAVWLDNNVHDSYAHQLLPRAVGYSAGLLNYFFRGTLTISAPDRCLYALTDGSLTPYIDKNNNYQQQFTTIKAKIQNTTVIRDLVSNVTTTELMQSGKLIAIAKYKLRTDYLSDMSNDFPRPEKEGVEDNYSYSVSEEKQLSSAEIEAINNEPTEISFIFTSQPIPAGIVDLSLQVVFQGTLGNEADKAIAVGFKDLSEPTHITFWNTTDYTYNAGQLHPSTWDAKMTTDEKIAFYCPDAPEPNPNEHQVEYTVMADGQYGRIIFLADSDGLNFFRVTDTIQVDSYPVSTNSIYSVWPAIYNIYGNFADVYTFRGKSFHEATGYYYVSVPDANFWLANWPAVIDNALIPATITW